jgi:hypothetical protein
VGSATGSTFGGGLVVQGSPYSSIPRVTNPYGDLRTWTPFGAGAHPVFELESTFPPETSARSLDVRKARGPCGGRPNSRGASGGRIAPEDRGGNGGGLVLRIFALHHNQLQSIAIHGTRHRDSARPRFARRAAIGSSRHSGEMVDRGRIELPTPGFSVPCIRLSWRGLPDLEPQTGTQWIHLLEPASAISRALRAWLREVEAMEEAGCPR